MSIITIPELDEVQGKLADRRRTLATIFEEAGADLDMDKVKTITGTSAEKVDQIRALNDEVDDLGDRQEQLRTLAKGAENALADDADDGLDPGDSRPGVSHKSIGDLIAGSAVPTTKGVPVEFPEVTLKTLMTTSAGWAPETTRGPRLVDYATRPIELLERVPTTTTDETAVTYMEETTFTNNAAETAEGAAMPESELVLTEKSSTIRKIAVTLPCTDEQLEDVTRLRGYLDNRLPFMVRQRLSGQIVAGNGTAPNLRGILNVSGIQTQAKGADPTPDAIYKAMVLVMTTGQATPDTVVMNPLDWQDVRLLRTADGIYIWGNPSEAGPERIWGLPVVLAQAMTQNSAIVGDFALFSELSVKKGLVVESGFVGDNFKEGKQTIRAQMRAAFVVYRPAAFCSVTGI
jgi:HK97 family phage major capsid protein